MRRRSKDPRGRMCRCGHERSWHRLDASLKQSGSCKYGAGHPAGGCTCTHYHTTSERGPTTMSPKPKKERTLVEEYDAAYATLTAGVGDAFAVFNARVRKMLADGTIRFGAPREATSTTTMRRRSAVHREQPVTVHHHASSTPLSPCAREILATLAQWSLARPTLTTSFVAIFSGYSPRSGGVAKALAQLRAGGFIDGSASALFVTEHGRKLADKRPAIPRGKKMREQLLAMWTAKLDPCASLILTYLDERAPESASVAEIAEATRYSARSGGVAKAFATLRRLDLIKGTSKSMTISDAFGA